MNGMAVFDLGDNDYDEPTNGLFNGTVDAAFRKIDRQFTTFLIWKIENLNLVPLSKEQYGIFCENDSYIIYAASKYGQASGPNEICRDVKCVLEYHIHFWLGKLTTADKAGLSAYKTVELDIHLGGTAVQHREVQGNESPRFRSYFDRTGIRILTGPIPTVQKPQTHKFEPVLYKVKGKSYPTYLQTCAISWSSLNSGDVFILQTEKIIFIWVGIASSNADKLLGTKVALQLQSELKIPNVAFVDDGYEKTLSEEDKKEFSHHLPLTKRQVHQAEQDDENMSTAYNRTLIKLYKCAEYNGKYTVTEVKVGPLAQSDLSSEDVFIVDHSIFGIWVWVGRRASERERREAMRNARGFVKKKKYPHQTPVTRMVDGSESLEFKMLFSSWKNKDQAKAKYKGFEANPIIKQKVTKFDAQTMEDMPALSCKSMLIDDGSGNIRKWLVRKSEIVETQSDRVAVFFTSDCYLIDYTYTTATGDKRILYYWMGMNSELTDQGATALKLVDLDNSTGNVANLARSVQGCEPPHLLQLFKGKMRIFFGSGFDFDPSGKNLKTPVQYLLKVEGTMSYNSKATQVSLKASNLNTNHCFVLRNSGTYYVWCGCNSNGDNREVAKSFAGADFELILEGGESAEFWYAIGGQDTYCKDIVHVESGDFIAPRLFHCNKLIGTVKATEIWYFGQTDLIPDNVMILDAHDMVFIWCGKSSNKTEQRLSLERALFYLKSDPARRNPNTPIMQAKHDKEPPSFTGFFENWDKDLWKDYISYLELRETTEKENGKDSNAYLGPTGNSEFDQYPKYSMMILTGPRDELPNTIDPLKKEVHLTYDDFMALFKMNFQEFSSLPFWKQQELKKKVGIF